MNRYTFTTDELGVKIPQWFVDKWKLWCHMPEGCFPISSNTEGKLTHLWAALEDDLVTCLRSSEMCRSPGLIRIVWLGEEGDVLLSVITESGSTRTRLK